MAKRKSTGVRPKIKALEVNGFEDFPLEDYDYVVSCRTRLQTVLGRKYSSAIDKDSNTVRITRTA